MKKVYVILLLASIAMSGKSQTWSITGNSGTNPPSNFIGTTDKKVLVFKTNNKEWMRIGTTGNTGIGTTSPAWRLDVNGDLNINASNVLRIGGIRVLYDNASSGNNNLFIGDFSDTASSSGFRNTAVGSYSLSLNKGAYNTALGSTSLQFNTTGSSNTAIGEKALLNNTIGATNSALGSGALQYNTSANQNTAIGFQTLYSNGSVYASDNTALGCQTLFYNVSGSSNSATGNQSLYYNSSGVGNTANGSLAMYYNTTGYYNTANGLQAIYNNTSGYANTADGLAALNVNTTGTYNTALGTAANVSSGNLSNATAVGSNAIVNASNAVQIGSPSVSSIGGYVSWTNFSDGRYKRNIQQNVPGLQFINKLKPVTYTLDIDAISEKIYKNVPKSKMMSGMNGPNLTEDPEMKQGMDDKAKIIYTGFVAQDVEQAAQSIGYDFSGVDKPKDEQQSFYGLRYGDFVVPLVKAVQELSAKNDEKDSIITDLQLSISSLRSEIEELKRTVQSSSQLKKVQEEAFSGSKAQLLQNIPNPFNQSTTIGYYLPGQFSNAQISFYSQQGELLKSIPIRQTGNGEINLKMNDLPSGVYEYSLTVDGRIINTLQMEIAK